MTKILKILLVSLSIFNYSCYDENSTNPKTMSEKITINILDENNKPLQNADIMIDILNDNSLPLYFFNVADGKLEISLSELIVNYYSDFQNCYKIQVSKSRDGVTFRDIKFIIPIGNLNRELTFRPFNNIDDVYISFQYYIKDVNLYLIYNDLIKDKSDIKVNYKKLAIEKITITNNKINILKLKNVHYYMNYLLVQESNDQFVSYAEFVLYLKNTVVNFIK